MTGETPATAIAGMACFAAFRLFGFHVLRAARRALAVEPKLSRLLALGGKAHSAMKTRVLVGWVEARTQRQAAPLTQACERLSALVEPRDTAVVG